MSNVKRYFLIAVGLISFVIGAIGTIIPVLPTTPLILVSGYCFARSSETFDKWLKSTKIYQHYCADYVAHRSIPRKRKRKVILYIYILMGISILLAPIKWVKVLLIGLTIFLTIMVFKIIPDTEDVFDGEGRYIGNNKKMQQRFENKRVDIQSILNPVSEQN